MPELSNDMVKHSISDNELVLPYKYAIRAIDHLESVGCLVIAWEGFIRYPDGGTGHAIDHPGTMSFAPLTGEVESDAIARAADFARKTIAEAQSRWDEAPEVAGGRLYFCITYDATKNWSATK